MEKRKQGRPPTVAVTKSLADLLKTRSKEGLFPWKVRVGSSVLYIYAHSKIDAVRKVLTCMAIAIPCSVTEILEASRTDDINGDVQIQEETPCTISVPS